MIYITPNKITGFFVQLKETLGEKFSIGNKSISTLIWALKNRYTSKNYYNNVLNNKINYINTLEMYNKNKLY